MSKVGRKLESLRPILSVVVVAEVRDITNAPKSIHQTWENAAQESSKARLGSL